MVLDSQIQTDVVGRTPACQGLIISACSALHSCLSSWHCGCYMSPSCLTTYAVVRLCNHKDHSEGAAGCVKVGMLLELLDAAHFCRLINIVHHCCLSIAAHTSADAAHISGRLIEQGNATLLIGCFTVTWLLLGCCQQQQTVSTATFLVALHASPVVVWLRLHVCALKQATVAELIVHYRPECK